MSETVALARLWTYLQAMPGGFRFRRNVVIDGRRAAICCKTVGVIVDVATDTSNRSDLVLARGGYRVLRFCCATIEQNMGDVCDEVVAVCRARLAERHAVGQAIAMHGGHRAV